MTLSNSDPETRLRTTAHLRMRMHSKIEAYHCRPKQNTTALLSEYENELQSSCMNSKEFETIYHHYSLPLQFDAKR